MVTIKELRAEIEVFRSDLKKASTNAERRAIRQDIAEMSKELRERELAREKTFGFID